MDGKCLIRQSSCPGGKVRPPQLPVDINPNTALTIDYDIAVATTSQSTLTFTAEVVYPSSFYDTRKSVNILASTDQVPSWADFQTHVTIDGEDYDYYKYISKPIFGTYASSTSHYFVNSIPTYTGRLQLHKFLNFLKDNGYEKFLERIDFITCSQEMWGGGTGTTTIRNYTITVK
jgi:hypothetical protein